MGKTRVAFHHRRLHRTRAVSIEQLLAMQTELMSVLDQNEAHGGVEPHSTIITRT
jgi:hypothetical protein